MRLHKPSPEIIKAFESGDRAFLEKASEQGDLCNLDCSHPNLGPVFRSLYPAANLNLSGLILQGTQFGNIFWDQVNFSGADLRNTDFSNPLFKAGSKREHVAKGATFRGGRLIGANLKGANLAGVVFNFQRQDDPCPPTDLTAACMENAMLESVIGHGCIFTRANLTKAWLMGGYLMEAVFEGAILKNAILESDLFEGRKTFLSKANLRNADLSDACFVRTRLDGALLGGEGKVKTVCDQTDFSGAHLTDADLRRLDLSKAKFSASTTIGGALIQGAYMPTHNGMIIGYRKNDPPIGQPAQNPPPPQEMKGEDLGSTFTSRQIER